MSYLKTYIPACEGYGWTGAPKFQTRIEVLMNGRERRNGDWAQEKNQYTIPFLNLTDEDYASVRQVFQVCRGMLHAFLYYDPRDNTAVNEVFAVATGATEYPLSKASTLDGVTYQRQINALYIPNADGTASQATPIVTVNGTPTAVTVDYDRALVTFAVAPTIGAILRWSGSFSVWVRFNADWLPFSIDSRNHRTAAHNGSVELIELPAPPEVET